MLNVSTIILDIKGITHTLVNILNYFYDDQNNIVFIDINDEHHSFKAESVEVVDVCASQYQPVKANAMPSFGTFFDEAFQTL